VTGIAQRDNAAEKGERDAGARIRTRQRRRGAGV